jgi:hypothetical protein
MKLRQCLCSSFYSLQPLVNFARPRRTLSTITKKPASAAGSHYLSFCLTRLITLFLLPSLLSATARSSQSFIQIPNYPSPA